MLPDSVSLGRFGLAALFSHVYDLIERMIENLTWSRNWVGRRYCAPCSLFPASAQPVSEGWGSPQAFHQAAKGQSGQWFKCKEMPSHVSIFSFLFPRLELKGFVAVGTPPDFHQSLWYLLGHPWTVTDSIVAPDLAEWSSSLTLDSMIRWISVKKVVAWLAVTLKNHPPVLCIRGAVGRAWQHDTFAIDNLSARAHQRAFKRVSGPRDGGVMGGAETNITRPILDKR